MGAMKDAKCLLDSKTVAILKEKRRAVLMCFLWPPFEECMYIYTVLPCIETKLESNLVDRNYAQIFENYQSMPWCVYF